MTRILATRLAQIALTLAILSFCAFALIALMPGDPIEMAIAGDPRLTGEDAARLRALHGLDRPFTERYLAWASGLLRGEFGYSRLFAQPVVALLGPALLSTLALAGSALAIALLARVGLGDRLDHRPGRLSGGESQRAAVVRALINRPRLLLADEPTGSLDEASARALGDLLVALNRDEGVALLVVTHSRDLAARLAAVARLENGRLA